MMVPKTKMSTIEVFWPRISGVRSAARAAKAGAASAYMVAALTGTIAIYAIFYGPVWGFDGYALADAVLMLIAGWRIGQLSKTWAVVGLLYWVGNIFVKLSDPQPGLRPIGVVSIIILLGFISGLRGTFAFSKFSARAHQDGQASPGPPLSDAETIEARQAYSRLPTLRVEELLAASADLRPGAVELLREELERRRRNAGGSSKQT